MLITKAARRYATMFLELGKDRDGVEALLEDMDFINNTMDDSHELELFLKSPIVNHDDKQAVLKELFGDKIHEPTRLFLTLLVRKDRINLLHQITRSYIEKYRSYAGIIDLKAYVAYDLTSSQKEKLHRKLEEITSKQVHLTVEKDPALKGGMAVRINDTVIDGTVKHKLQALEDEFLSSTAV